MGKRYFPIRFIDVPASAPHAENTAYRVSYGSEHWDDGAPKYVYKVQMVYDGKVSGRRSPSYPSDCDDLDQVMDALDRIKAGEGGTGRGMVEALS